MTNSTQISRRDVLKLMGLGAGGAFLSACGLLPSASTNPTAAPVFPTPLTPLPDLPIRN